jgi:O-antigen/teichoic acid export membrane protein
MGMRQTAAVRSAVLHVRTPLYLNAYALIASNLLTSALGVVFWSLAAHLYSVEVLGVSSAVISTMLFITGVAQLNLRTALIRLVPEAGPGTGRLVVMAYAVTLAASFLLGVAAFGTMAILGTGTLALEGLATPFGILLLAVGTMAWSVFNLQDGVLAGLRRTVWVPVENGLFGVAKIVALVALVVSMPALGIVVSWIVPMVICVVVVSVALARWIPAHMAASPGRAIAMRSRQLLRFVAADYVGSLCALSVAALVPVVIVAVSGPRAGAYLYIVWTISTSLNLLPVNMCASMMVETVHADAHVGTEARRVAVHMARILVPIVLGVVVFADWILGIFGPEYVEAGALPLRILALGVLPYGVNVLYLATARINGMGREIVATQVALAALTIGGAVLLVGSMGITGVAVAWFAAQAGVAAFAARRLWPLMTSRAPQ